MSINELATQLKLPYIKEHYDELIKEAEHCNLDYNTFLKNVLEGEVLLRSENSIQTRIARAKFPQKKYLVDFDKRWYANALQSKFKELERLEFIENKENIIMIGNPGTGKSHYAIALGIKACMEGKKVLFSSVPNLVIELKEAMSRSQITQYKKKFEKYDLVILDELGYISFDKEGSDILFNILSNRNDVGSIIITTNLSFERWEEIFKDPIITGAMVDRLAYKSHVLDMSGESYRIKQTITWLNEKPN